MNEQSHSRSYFDRMYQRNPDPWNFRTSAYEQEKYAATIGMIDDRRYGRCLEVGCSIGVLSAHLAPLCSSFLGIDISERPLAHARRTCAAYPHAEFHCMNAPGKWPTGEFDLIILSEVLYFLSLSDIDALAAKSRASLMPGGRVLLVNWLGTRQKPEPGDVAADRFLSATDLRVTARRHPLYRIDLLDFSQAR